MKAEIKQDIKELLELKYQEFQNPSFIELDPIQIPHKFSIKEDIEISAFLTAIISWGNRKAIIKSANEMMEKMGNSPYDFVMNHRPSDIEKIRFQYRTFLPEDFRYFLKTLQIIYRKNGLEQIFSDAFRNQDAKAAISNFHDLFLSFQPLERTKKHIANPQNGSSAKRINMFLRWMVRKDFNEIDFGIWNEISPSQLYLPLDVHTGNVSRSLGLLERKSNDWKALEEIMNHLRQFDPKDPVKYDFALFGLGINKEI